MNWTLEKTIRPNVHILHFDGPTGEVFLSSDWHWDNPKCIRQALEYDLRQACKRGLPICCFGDLFCVMQGKYDKRSSKNDIRPEHQKPNYLNALVDTFVEWAQPFKNNLAILSPGNHEGSILKRCEFDLLQEVVKRLQDQGSPVQLGGYGGWILNRFNHNNCGLVVRTKYHHGHGGGGPVTRGSIQAQRRAAMLDGADVVASGHVHEAYIIKHPKEVINDNGRNRIKTQTHVTTPGYKEEYAEGSGGFHIEGGRPPKPIGSALQKMRFRDCDWSGERRRDMNVDCQFTEDHVSFV